MTVNVLWVADHPVGKQKLKDMKRFYGEEMDLYHYEEEKIDDILKIIELAEDLNIDILEWDQPKELA